MLKAIAIAKDKDRLVARQELPKVLWLTNEKRAWHCENIDRESIIRTSICSYETAMAKVMGI